MHHREFKISGQIIDVLQERIFPGTLHIAHGRIQQVVAEETASPDFILPGLIDAHVHIESSMLVPAEFARLAVVHGTVATVSDPHEIANVMGLAGVDYMIENGRQVPFKFNFGAPSCVPATPFETAGARLSAEDIEELFLRPEIKYLAEMMNWPGVLHHDPEVMQKILLAQKFGKVVDGHAPGLRGEQARQYAAAGMSTDHECFTAEEALEKLGYGMHILIREGSAARNFDALIGLLPAHSRQIMFCSDDKHPDNLVEGHINQLVKRALAKGIDLLTALRAACVNPVLHYGLEVGLLRPRDPADFIVIDNPRDFNVLQTYIDGHLVAERGQTRIASAFYPAVNHFNTGPKTPDQFRLPAPGPRARIRVMEAFDGQLITGSFTTHARIADGHILADPENDILKIAVVNRYQEAEPAVAFIRHFGLRQGAIASSVGHDSHNIIAVGTDEQSLCEAVNQVIAARGGICATGPQGTRILPLPVAGIMSAADGYEVAAAYSGLDALAKEMGSTLASPFMTLSFMGLLVIPELKLSDRGLFNGKTFAFTPVVVAQEA